MANIMLTDACNLRCSYCFANEFVNVGKNEITLDAFSKALDFILSDGSESVVGIIGGEPTLHPLFDTMMRMAIMDNRASGIMLYTNGLRINEHWDTCCHAKTHLLINCNSPTDIGDTLYARLCDNLDILLSKKLCGERVTLGINMYKPDFEYVYLINLLKKYNMQHVRVSITVPNVEKQRNTNAHDYFLKMKPYVLKFFHDLLSNDIIPHFDCNKIPSCLIEESELACFSRYLTRPQLRDNLGKSNIMTKRVSCSPVVDIRQDLTAVRCFGLSTWTKQRIEDFKGIRDLKNYYLRTIDSFAFNTVYTSSCTDCYDRKVLSCNGGCLAFKIKGILELANFAERQTKYDHSDQFESN